MLGTIFPLRNWNSLSRRILNGTAVVDVCSTPHNDFECMAVVVLLIILIAHLHLLVALDTNISLTDPNLVIAPEIKVPKINHRLSFTSPSSSCKNTASVTFCNGREVQRCMTGSLTAGAAPRGTLANISIRSLRKRNGWLYNCYRPSSASSRLCSLSFLHPAVAPQPVTDTVIATNPRREEGELVPQATPSFVGQAKCRPSVRSSPLRLSLPKPDRTYFFLDTRRERDSTARDSPSASDTGASSSSSSEIGCGDVEGGMTSTFTWLESVNSTMDEAKTLAVKQKGNGTSGVFAVAAREQLRGRGTKGRAWLGLPGNVFLTVAIPLERVPVPLSLIPLRVGTLIAPEIERRLWHRSTSASAGTEDRTFAQPDDVPHRPRVSLKWPNDVLLEGKKVAGVLIEAQLPFLLVGIGVNVRNKPDVPQQGPDRGRPAACLAEYGGDSSDQAVRALSATLTEALCSWVSGEDSAELALAEWSRWVDWTLPLEIRDERRVVTPVGVASDGRLRVVDPDTGEEKLLATEYLF